MSVPAIIVVVAVVTAMGLWPFAMVLASRWSKSDSRLRRGLGRGCGGVLLYASFNLSFLTIWGAVLRPQQEVTMVWLAGLGLLQPVGVVLVFLVVGARTSR
ncbi:MAG: hypothetical protein KC593_02510 [Myxococcales bacterium]|nr:hypothetical protein [Myxococcales bacterium]